MPRDTGRLISTDEAARIRSLDGLRGVAITLVVAYHLYARWVGLIPWITPESDSPILKYELRFLGYGYLGVQLFFLISGFVIYKTLANCRSLSEFIFRRWLRLFPAMLVVSLLVYATSFYLTERPRGDIAPADLLPGILLVEDGILNALQNQVHAKAIEGAFWSLFIEVKFYLIFGTLYFLSQRHALKNLILVFLVTPAYFALAKVVPEVTNELIRQLLFGFNYFGWFCIGALTYKSCLEKNQALSIASVGLLIPTLLMNYEARMETLLAATMVYLAFVAALRIRLVSSVLSSRIPIFLGFISYPLYLVHENALIAMTIKTHAAFDFVPDAMTPWPGIVLLVAFSFVIAKYFEPMARKAILLAISSLGTRKKQTSRTALGGTASRSYSWWSLGS